MCHSVTSSSQCFYYSIYVSIDGSRTTKPSLEIRLPPRKAAALPTSTDLNESDVWVFLPLNVMFYTIYRHLSHGEQLPESRKQLRSHEVEVNDDTPPIDSDRDEGIHSIKPSKKRRKVQRSSSTMPSTNEETSGLETCRSGWCDKEDKDTWSWSSSCKKVAVCCPGLYLT